MKILGRILLFLPLLLFALATKAQLPAPTISSNLRIKKVSLKPDSLLLDTTSIVPNSFRIISSDTTQYRLDFVRSVLHWKVKPGGDSVVMTYRVFPFRLNSVVQRFNYDSIVNNVYLRPFVFKTKASDEDRGLLDFGNIQANGSLGRELSFGNSQDAVVNSNFQLEINGMLKDSIELSAAFTDNNIPIQPDGTTTQLNEFDRVFLQFKKKNWQLNLGDIDIRQNSMYFLNFYKRLQGVSFQTTTHLSPTSQSTTLVSGSIAKGKFNRNVFQGLEGNQGPYRLTGANNEFFFIVLANTERVYLDGELLQRGEDQDYIINYNTAEVTFMPKRMITKDSRIQIEFEYADRNFLNANFYLNQEFDLNKRLKLTLGVFTNSDAKNSQINQNLDTKQKQFLFGIGDSIQKAFYPTVAQDSFSTEKILYEKQYYQNGTIQDSFYRYSVDPSVARYSLSFSDVGAGNGNYVPDFNGANGKVYRFVQPVNGVKQGQYEPVMILVTPKKQQLVSLGTEYQIDKNSSLKTEFAISNYDVNTFSSKDGGDDMGVAARIQFTNSKLLNASRKLQLNSTFDYEYVQDKFKPIERLRYVEFTREWGLPLVLNPATENILRLSTQLKSPGQSLTYQFMTYQRSDDYKGYQNILLQRAERNGWTFNNQFAITNFNSVEGKGNYLRPVLDVSRTLKQFGSLKLGLRYALERNEVRDQKTDTLSAQSFSFDTYSAYLKTNEAKKNHFGVSFFTRSDKYPVMKQMLRGDRSYNTNVEAQVLRNPHHQLLFSATYRILKVDNQSLTNQKDDRTILGRTEYMVNEWKGLLTGNALYELGTGQEQRRDYAYFEVPAGQGEYTWIDYNNDGIQQVNEFEIAAFRDQAKFIRIFIPTNQFVKANYTTLNYSFTVNPRAVLKGDLKGFGKFLSRFNLQTSMQKSKKSIAKGDFEFSPFKYDIQDTALLTLNTSLLNSISFNRYSSNWGLDLSNLQNTGKSLLTYGYETRKAVDWMAKGRLGLSRTFSFDITSRKGLMALYTPSFSNRNYELDIYSLEPRLIFVEGTNFRVQTSYKLEEKKNLQIYGGERSVSNAINLESKYNVLQNGSINAQFTFNNISFSKPGITATNPSVEYIILDGLSPGHNYLWSVDFTKKLFHNLELNLQYEGRKPGETKTVHVGRAAVRALF
ncbi:MAG: hypothetical protein ACJ75B_14020 [Flavisolibacter sp.]